MQQSDQSYEEEEEKPKVQVVPAAPVMIRVECEARRWQLTGVTWKAASGLVYYYTACGRRIAYNRRIRKFVVLEADGTMAVS